MGMTGAHDVFMIAHDVHGHVQGGVWRVRRTANERMREMRH